MKTQEKVIEVIRENTNWDGDLTMDMHLTVDLGIDSLDMMMIVNELEDAYSIEVEKDCLKDLKTVGNVIEKLDQLVSVNI